jgi:hypothetical protein
VPLEKVIYVCHAHPAPIWVSFRPELTELMTTIDLGSAVEVAAAPIRPHLHGF